MSAAAKENVTFLKQYNGGLEVGGFGGSSTPKRQESPSFLHRLLCLHWFHK